MPYPEIAQHRLNYDSAGVAVGYATASGATGLRDVLSVDIDGWLTPEEVTELNSAAGTVEWGVAAADNDYVAFVFMFAEPTIVTGFALQHPADFAGATTFDVLVSQSESTESTNPYSGPWEEALSAIPTESSSDADEWRQHVYVSPLPAVPVHGFKVSFGCPTVDDDGRVIGVHLYGTVTATHDVVFCDVTTGAVMTKLMDWGTLAEGMDAVKSFKVKNISQTKRAETVEVSSTDPAITFSQSPTGPWASSVSFATLTPLGYSPAVYVRHAIGVPAGTLGLLAERVEVTVATWVDGL